MSHHEARVIRLLQIQNFFLRQLDINPICKWKFITTDIATLHKEHISRTNQILEFLDARTASNWRRDSCQRPRQGDLRHAYAALLGYLFDPSRFHTNPCSSDQDGASTDLLTISKVPGPSR